MTNPSSAPAEARTDAVAVALLVVAGLALWATGGSPGTEPPAGGPWWARLEDHLLDGPDAGAWASNAMAIALGRTADLDPHRLPILPYLTAAVMQFEPNVALAGHLVNHVLHVLLGPVIYLLARAWMSRGMAFGAAITALTFPLGLAASARYGVDPLVTLAIPAAMLAAETAARNPASSPLMGVLIGWASACHLTTIGTWAPALLLCLLRGQPGFRRWLGTLGTAAGVLIGVGLAFYAYPTLPMDLLVGSLAEGVAPTGPTGGTDDARGVLQKAIAIVQAGGPAALNGTIVLLMSAARPSWIPWSAALVLPWLGFAGVAVGERPDPRRWWGWVFGGMRAGIPLAGALVPVLAFVAAGSPPRYSANFMPLGIVAVFRGMSVLPTVIDRIAARWPRWRPGVLAVLVGLGMAGSLWREGLARALAPAPPMGRDLADWRLGTKIAELFPAGGGAACLRREAIAYAGRVYCPYSPGYNFRNEKEPFRAHLTTECPGEGPIPYVVVGGEGTGASAERLAMDAWVEANAPLVGSYTDAFVEARIYAVERTLPE